MSGGWGGEIGKGGGGVKRVLTSSMEVLPHPLLVNRRPTAPPLGAHPSPMKGPSKPFFSFVTMDFQMRSGENENSMTDIEMRSNK